MEIITKKISELKNWDKNPRSISEENFNFLKKRIKMFGIFKPLILDGRDMSTILGGNMRLKALVELGYDEVECSVVYPKSDNEAIEFALVDNNSSGNYEKDKLISLVEGVEINISDIRVDLKPIKIENLLNSIDEDNISNIDYESEFSIVIDCKDEKEQNKIYDDLVKMGIKCRILTL